MVHVERVTAEGHENVRAAHESTFELTTDDYLTPAGDCILGIEADHAPSRFDAEFVEACQNEETVIEAELQVGQRSATITGRGDPDLSFESDRSLVGRTSTYVDGRTVMVEADAAAADLDRELVAALKKGTAVELVLRARTE